MNTFIDDNDLDSFVYDVMQKYKGKIKSLVMDHRSDDDKDYIKLVGISIKNKAKGEGIGQSIMLEIIDYADNHSIPIKLQATDVLGSDIDRLVNFYKKFGFVETDKEHNMTYTPTNTNQ